MLLYAIIYRITFQIFTVGIYSITFKVALVATHAEEHAKFCLELKSRSTRLTNSIYTENTYISSIRCSSNTYRYNSCRTGYDKARH